ncbi:hypothetical protein [Micromonospora sp. NPDC050495]|uniref:hypothetical protein n=1 Tax=Micromonospora sp. NPDC050495 TaxID=3154936 RepID=UPI0033FABABB
MKVGICAAGSSRVLAHKRQGWNVIRLWRGIDGSQAREVEFATLSWWRSDLGLPFGAAKDDLPQAGYTETAPLGIVDIGEVIAKISTFVSTATTAKARAELK